MRGSPGDVGLPQPLQRSSPSLQRASRLVRLPSRPRSAPPLAARFARSCASPEPLVPTAVSAWIPETRQARRPTSREQLSLPACSK